MKWYKVSGTEKMTELECIIKMVKNSEMWYGTKIDLEIKRLGF